MRDILFALDRVLVYSNREDANCHPAGLGRNSLVACVDFSRQRMDLRRPWIRRPGGTVVRYEQQEEGEEQKDLVFYRRMDINIFRLC